MDRGSTQRWTASLSVTARMMVLNGLMVILTAGTVSVALHLHAVEEMQTQLGECLRHIAATGALSIDPNLHAQIRTREDTKKPAFGQLQHEIERITRANELPLNAVYTLRPVRGEQGEPATEFIAMAGTPFTGDRYVLRPEMQQAMSQRTVTYTPAIYQDQYGAWLSAYAPLITKDGEVDGLLEVDYHADRILALTDANRDRAIFYALMCILIAVVLSTVTVRYTMRPLGALTRGISAVKGGQYGHRMEVGRAAPELRYIAGSFNDMATSIADREAVLETSERRYRTLYEASRDAIFVVDARSGLILDVNQACVGLTGLERDRLLGLSFVGLFGADESKPDTETDTQMAERLLNTARTQELPALGHLMLTDSEGKLRHVDARSTGLELDDGPAFLVTCRDVTQQLQEWARLMQASKLAALGEMAGGLAHEINNPLVGVLNFAQLLNRALPEDDPNRELVETIEQGAVRCRDIVKALLRFGRRDAVSHSAVSVETVIEEARRLSHHQVELGGGSLKVEVADELPCIRGNSVQLTQVLLNLIGNAAQASQKAHILINARCEADKIVVEVSDDGPGIEPSVRARIFEPFFTTKAEGEGTGLGLSVAYSIVGQHKGELTLKEDSGQGTTFRMTLPVKDDTLQEAMGET